MSKLKFLSWLFLLLALAGFFDAVYLTAKHFLKSPVVCSLTGGCEQVLTSQFATLGPVPISLIGAGYYFVLLILVIIFLETQNKKIANFLLLLTSTGFLISVGLVGLQAFVLEAYCAFCLLSALISTLLAVISTIIFKQLKVETRNQITN